MSHTLPIMLFFLALFLIALGAYLDTITAHYPAWTGGYEYHPYRISSQLLIIVGIIVLPVSLVVAILSMRKPRRADLPPSIMITAKKYCRYCGSENKSDASYCEKCGKSLG